MPKTRTWLAVVALGIVTFAFQNCGPAFAPVALEGEISLSSITLEKSCGNPAATGARVGLRSLSNDEYKNSVRDVLGVAPDLNAILPTNPLGNSGFRNDAEMLGNFDLDHLQKFYDAAELIAAAVAAGQNNSGSAYHKLLHCSLAAAPAGAVHVTPNLVVDPRSFATKTADGSGTLGANYETQGYEWFQNGRVTQRFFVRKTGAYTLQLSAAQRKGKTGDAHMVLTVNGVAVKDFNVSGDRTFANYAATVNLAAGPQEVSIIFDNDAYLEEGGVVYDRNLIVRSLTWSTALTGLDVALTGDACLKAVYSELAARLFRRGLGDAEVTAQANRLVAMTKAATTVPKGVADSVVTLLMDPRFLLVRHDAAGGRLTDLGLASKLAFLLWQSVPDDELREDGAAGRLQDPDVLKAHVRRMLQDDRAKRLAGVLRTEWLGLANFESGTFEGLPASLQSAYIKETTLFLEDLIKTDRPLSWLLRSDQTFVNKELAGVYGLTFPSGVNANNFVAVSTAGSVRQGVVAQAAVLAATAGGTSATHPVRRGVWVADRILCEKPPPPPPGIPALPNDAATEGTIRKRLEQHTKSAACMGCHQKIDLYGLGMENFDPFGRWRDRYHDNSVVESWGADRSAGLEFANSRQLVEQLPTVNQAQACVAESLVRLGQNRAANSYEKCASGVIGQVAFNSGMVFSDYVYNLVSSPAFGLQAE